MSPPPPRSTLFPYTTLFRSLRLQDREQQLDFVGIVTRPDAEGVAGLIDEPGTREIDDDVARFLFRVRPAERSEEHTSELQSQFHLVCRLLLEKKKKSSTRPS